MRVRTLAIIILAIALVTAIAIARVRGKDAANPGERDIVQVERGTVRLTVSADGILQPLTTVAVKSYAGGAVEVLPVEVGDIVKAGDLIAKIDPTDSLTTYNQAVADLNAAQARLRQAQEQSNVQPTLTQAAIAQAEASYNSALKDLEALEKAAQPQARAQARATLDKAQANADIAEKELIRTQELKDQGFVPQSEVDTAVNRRDLAKAELTTAQQRWDTLEQELTPELESAQARVAQAKAGLDRARADAVQDQLRVADVTSAQAQVARAQAQVDNARTMLDYTTIRAPRDGVILEKAVEQGTIITSGRSSITQGTDIVTLGDLTKMFAEVSLDEADVGRARVGQQVEITIDAFPNQRFRGIVTRINPQAVTQQNVTTVLVKVEIENPAAHLKPGMTASCEFLVNQADNVLYLPSRAVREVGGEYVVSVQKGGEVTEVPVTVGLVGDDRIEIREGLTEGREVVLPSLATGSQESRSRATEFGRRAAGGGAFFRSSGSGGPPPPPR
jgi:HlyD family secretion protein